MLDAECIAEVYGMSKQRSDGVILRFAQRVLIVVCLMIAVLVAAAFVALRLIGGQLLAVQNDSMQPVFAAGDALIVRPLQPGAIRPGMIISYHNPAGDNTIVSRRAVAIDKKSDAITAKGDAQKLSSSVTVPDSQIIGRAAGVVPGFGRVMAVMRNPFVLTVLVYLPVAILLARKTEQLRRYFAKPRYRLVERQ